MRRLLAIAFLAALAASPALAAEDVMAGYYGNTAVSTGGPAELHTHYRADHTFDLKGSMSGISIVFKGTWVIDSKGQLCRSFVGQMPPHTTNPVCSRITAHKVGDTWTTFSADGSLRTISLQSGIH